MGGTATTTQLEPTTIASSATNGALLEPLDAGDIAAVAVEAIADPAALAQYVNAGLANAEDALPEGALVQLDITGWLTPLGSTAQWVATQINSAWAAGRILNVDGTPVEAWPGQSYLAVGDDATDTVTIQAVKGQPPLVWIVVGVMVLLGIVVLWGVLTRSKWAATLWQETKTTGKVLSWTLEHLPYILLAAGGVAAVAVVAPLVAGAEEGAAKVERGTRDLRSAR